MYINEAKSEASSSSCLSSLLLSPLPVILAEKFTRIISALQEANLSFLMNFQHANIWDHGIAARAAIRIFGVYLFCKQL